MNTVTIPQNATTQSILQSLKPPRGATHFRYTEGRRKPVIDSIKNINILAGCTGKLEFGKVTFEGRGRQAKIKEFTPMAQTPEATNQQAKAIEANRPVEEANQQAKTIEAARPAEVIEGEVSPAPKNGHARKNKILGFSACAVAKALGAAGVKYPEADRIFRAHGIEMPKASLSVQLGFGRRPETWERHGKPAELSAEQINALRQGVQP
jgi:hypothetical protein